MVTLHNKTSLTKAADLCESLDSSLPHIVSEKDHEAVVNVVYRGGQNSVWIGLKKYTFKSLFWQDGKRHGKLQCLSDFLEMSGVMSK